MSFNAACPVCDAELNFGADTVKDELVSCGDCGSELVVASVDPMALEEAPQAEEDWGE